MQSNLFRAGWYVIYTKPRHEKRVSDDLSKAEIPYFLPTAKKLRNWSGRRRYIEEPLFPSYIFTYLKDNVDYYNSLGIESVLYYVRSGKEVACVKDAVINNIRLMVNEGSDLEVTGQLFRPGQQMVIQQGPLTGLACEVVECNDQRKILIRVHLLQRNLLMSLPSESLLLPGYPSHSPSLL